MSAIFSCGCLFCFEFFFVESLRGVLWVLDFLPLLGLDFGFLTVSWAVVYSRYYLGSASFSKFAFPPLLGAIMREKK